MNSVSMDLQEALDLFLELPKKPETIRGYRHALGLLIGSIGARNDVRLVSKQMIISYANKLHRRDISPHTINREIRTIKAFFNWLVRIDVLETSPADAISEKRTEPRIDRAKAATREEMQRVAWAAYGNARNYALVRFLEDTGCRAIELSRLRIDRVNFDDLEALVHGKNDIRYVVDFSSSTGVALQKWLEERPKVGHDFVFCGLYQPHEQMTADAIRLVVRRLSWKAGVRSLGTHAWRHAKGFALADQKTPVTIAAGVLGHTNAQTTMRWYYPQDRESVKAASRRAFVEHPEDMLSDEDG